MNGVHTIRKDYLGTLFLEQGSRIITVAYLSIGGVVFSRESGGEPRWIRSNERTWRHLKNTTLEAVDDLYAPKPSIDDPV